MDMRHLLEQAKNLEKALAEIDERLAAHVSEGVSEDGRVHAKVNGQGDVVELVLSDDLATSGDAELVARTCLAALSAATTASRLFREEQRASLTGGLKLPEF